jgi:hypothetical protein
MTETRTTYTPSELTAILSAHREWLDTYWMKAGTQKGARAVLTGADLRGAVLTDVVLTGAVLTGADLTDADLTGAVLADAVLAGADLTDADLTGAVLTRAVLRGAVLTGADLTDADLTGAVLGGAVLTDADLRGAVLGDGYTQWEQYKSEVVPTLLVAGGKSLDEVANPESWNCHSWSNCPMHAAFGVDSLADVPALYRRLASEFIQFFDARLLPLGEINPTYAGDATAGSCEVPTND